MRGSSKSPVVGTINMRDAMRKLSWSAVGALVVLVTAAHASPELVAELEIGSRAPLSDVKMLDVSGDQISLEDAAGPAGLLVVFSCNTCPYVKAWEDRYLSASEKARDLGIGMIALNPNEAYRNRGDSYDDMKARAAEVGYAFPYVLDEDSRLADAFGATRTPQVFLFNADLELVYRGAIDDNSRSAADVDAHYLSDAMEAMVDGRAVSVNSTRSIGCEIKRS
jgi:peroxiredoxin